jgi:unsaturated rhamnogalacturonyl hydrolase
MTDHDGKEKNQDMECGMSTRELLSAVVARTLDYDFTIWFWGDAIAIDGLLDAAEALDDECAYDRAKQFLVNWSQRDIGWVDHLTPGGALLRIWRRENDGRLLDAALRLARRLNNETPRAGGAPLYRPDVPTYRHAVWVDSLYHVPSFYAALAHATGDESWFNAAVREWTSHTTLLRDNNGPFLGHSFDTGTRCLHGYGWGRGVGWALYGMLETLALIPKTHPDWERLEEEALELAAALLPIQDESGFWRTLLHDREAYLESSTASFFAAAFRCGVRNGILPDCYAGAADRAVAATKSRIDRSGELWGVSACTYAGVVNLDDATMYRTLPTEVNVWGQGSALRALAEQLKVDTP